ncbi:MAG TPA: MBL fold metallo-hydrolase [Ktedonobacteraceae bacterium]|jgi:glyoxylase-like metal-dependent hydrolase (beta-lactamase superfamily II)|nr:MBL fold metallo-hydrolase [Ktedonobacteraceae bacterium]
MQQPSPAQHRRADQPLPETLEVAPGIWKITVPIPFPLRTVNMHAIVGKDGWALIDTGMGIPDARMAFSAGLERAGLTIDTLRAIVLTHHHPDHVGLSGELYKQSGAAVYMHPIDEAGVQILWKGTMPQRFGSVSQFFSQHGMPPTTLWFSQVDPELMRSIISVPPHEAFTLVEDDQHIDLVGEDYRVIWVPGHSDGQICLLRERDGVFFAADHVLPRITPNVGLYSPHDRQNPLRDYLNSLAKVMELPASIVLPGHGEPFSDLAGRAREIVAHHEEREKEILGLLDGRPQHAYELAMQLFGNRLNNNEAQRMGVAEVLSHLEYLRYNGQVEQQKTGDGLILYTAA